MKEWRKEEWIGRGDGRIKDREMERRRYGEKEIWREGDMERRRYGETKGLSRRGNRRM